MRRIHRDAYSAMLALLALVGGIWLMLAVLNPVR